MKIGILTFHNAINYGAELQAYALKITISKMNNGSCDIINYCNKEVLENGNPFIFKKRSMVQLLKILSQGCGFLKKQKACRKFVTDYLVEGNIELDKSNIKENIREYDKIVVGSDQVWNVLLTKNDMNYFLPSIEPQKKIAYAVSMGDREMGKEILNKIIPLINDFSCISARGKWSTNYLLKNGISHCKTVPDPVFLLGTDEWKKIIKPIDEDNYVLIYCVNKSVEVLDLAKKIHKEEGKKIIFMNQNILGKITGFTYVYGGSPVDFLSYLYHADLVLTNSFHATALSIVLNKNFYSDIGSEQTGINHRVKDLLEEYDLMNRTIDNYNKDIKKVIINQEILKKTKAIGLEYLKGAFYE